MRLSDAIALGRTLIMPCRFEQGRPGASGRRDPSREGSGCALDMAVVAVQGSGNWHDAAKIWTWLSNSCESPSGAGSYFFEVAYKFDFFVCDKGTMTLDQLIDWVRAVEPSEPPAPLTATVTTPAENALKVRLNLEAVR